MKIKFSFNYETEKSVRFDEIEEPHKVGSLYLKKWKWEQMGKPKKLVIEVIADQ